jgi:hypothetical protein
MVGPGDGWVGGSGVASGPAARAPKAGLEGQPEAGPVGQGRAAGRENTLKCWTDVMGWMGWLGLFLHI